MWTIRIDQHRASRGIPHPSPDELWYGCLTVVLYLVSYVITGRENGKILCLELLAHLLDEAWTVMKTCFSLSHHGCVYTTCQPAWKPRVQEHHVERLRFAHSTAHNHQAHSTIARILPRSQEG